MGEQLYLTLSVQQCSSCHGNHERVTFRPVAPGECPFPNYSHVGMCPTTYEAIWMDTQVNPGVWERLLKAAGV